MVDLSLRDRIYQVIFGTDTVAGQRFDIVLIYLILVSVLAVVLDSIAVIHSDYGSWLFWLEWGFTALFSLEYCLRIYSSPKPLRYIFSFYGVIDFLSTIPKYLTFILVGSHSLVALRALRLMRIFRILKLARFIGESTNFARALKASRAKIAVFN